MRFEICQDEDEDEVKGRVIAIVYLSIAVVLARTGKNEEPEPILSNKEEAMGREAYEGKQVYLEGYFDRLLPRLRPLLKECKASLTRLDLGTVFYTRDFPLQILLNLLSQSVTDVGLPIRFEEDLNTLFDSKLHTRIHTLRLRFWINHLDKAWKLLILNDSSTIRFFDCTIIDDKLMKPLQGLACTKPPAALTALKIRFSINFNSRVRNPDTFANVANYLSSPAACNLVHFDVTFAGSREVGAAMTDWEVANSLLNNFTLCTFNFPFADAAAESYAITLLRRNRLYRDSNLLNEPQVKPNVARLFLCGHGGVGKTTLRLALQPQHSWPKRSFTGMCCLSSRPEPTRGMETHDLSLQHPHKKLLICDLAGQEEFHVFHHYFMNASINDIFMVVCKYDNTCLPLTDFRLQLEYWLRFLASHRGIHSKSINDSDANRTEMKPKVIVVVNFFQEEEHADAITHDWTSPLMQKFSGVLDFAIAAVTQQPNRFKNLFGLNARTRFRVQELEERLKSLLNDFDIAGLPIPRLCYDIFATMTSKSSLDDPEITRVPITKLRYRISAHRWKNWLCANNTLATGKGKLRLLTSYEEVLNEVSKHAAGDQSFRVRAALQELHAQGYIIFFSTEGTDAAHGMSKSMKEESVGENSTKDTLVITDTNWFSNKLVGSLLGARLPGAPNRPCPWEWKVEEIRSMLRRQGCAEHQLGEILRYLERLELCVSLDGVPGADNGYLLFPALVENKEIVFPEGSKANSTTFFGRRIRCENPSIHLIPFAVFTRLQVKLHRAYAAGNDSFKLGYGWISFMRGRVGAVVRYGGDVINNDWECKQQIDILLFCPEIHGKNSRRPTTNSNTESFEPRHHMNDPKLNAAGEMLDEIRSHFYATCKEGDLGGIPAVTVEEMVLQDETGNSGFCRLSDILNKVRTQDLLESYQEWRTSLPTRVLDLLLPKEIEGVVTDRLDALARIKEEFSEGGEDEDVEYVDEHQSGDATADSSQLSGDVDMKLFIKSEIGQLKEFIYTNLQTVRADIRKLEDVQRQVMQTVIANCSTVLLRHELRKDRAYGLYPYLADAKGKLAPLGKALFGRRKVRVHFLCEAPTDCGPHPVEGQKGKEVNIDWKPWVRKAARVMVPAVKVICFLARVVASVYLPSAQVFIPSPEVLVSGLGIEAEALQQVILPQALEALLKNVPDVDLREMMQCRPEEQEAEEVVAAILENQKVDMWADFRLKRVIFDEDEQSVHHRPLWVCELHARHKTELRPIGNPYRPSESSPLQ